MYLKSCTKGKKKTTLESFLEESCTPESFLEESCYMTLRGFCRRMSVHLLTRLTAADNSGAREIMCIGHFARKPAKVGDAIRAVVKSVKSGAKVTRKEVVAAVIVRTRGRRRRHDGSEIRFQENAAVLMKRDLSGPIGTRVIGPVAREVRNGQFMKLALLASRCV